MSKETFDFLVTTLSAAAAVPLVLTFLLMLIRPHKRMGDYVATALTGAMAAFFVLIWFRRVVEWPQWVALIYFLIAAVSAWGVFLWTLRSIHRS